MPGAISALRFHGGLQTANRLPQSRFRGPVETESRQNGLFRFHGGFQTANRLPQSRFRGPVETEPVKRPGRKKPDWRRRRCIPRPTGRIACRAPGGRACRSAVAVRRGSQKSRFVPRAGCFSLFASVYIVCHIFSYRNIFEEIFFTGAPRAVRR